MARFDALERKLEAKLNAYRAKFDRVDNKLDGLGENLAIKLEFRFSTIESKLDACRASSPRSLSTS